MTNKYYTCFTFSGLDPDLLHCTHKYLGALSFAELYEAKYSISIFYNLYYKMPIGFPRIRFDQEETFGPAGFHVRALTTVTPHRFRYWEPLQRELDRFRKDDYPYRPHVTTRYHAVIDERFYSYALVNSTTKEVIQEWENPVHDEAT